MSQPLPDLRGMERHEAWWAHGQREGSDGPGRITAFAIDGTERGVALEERLHVLPSHTVGTWTLKGCRVPARRIIGEPGQGFRIAMDALELFRPTVGAATLGFARRAMAEAIERSPERAAFKKPTSEPQLVQAKVADMAVSIDAAALLVCRAAWQHDETEQSISLEAAIAELYSVLDRSRLQRDRQGRADIWRTGGCPWNDGGTSVSLKTLAVQRFLSAKASDDPM
jgi:alkylation response protein AidB-like acyl-CoA dehydrogenase